MWVDHLSGRTPLFAHHCAPFYVALVALRVIDLEVVHIPDVNLYLGEEFGALLQIFLNVR